jgi:hypothetical protein
MNLEEQKKLVTRTNEVKDRKIKEIKSEIKTISDGKLLLEEKIYTVSIENKQK